MSFLLAIDGGGSKTEAVLSDAAGTVLARARAGPCNLYRDPAAGVAAVEAVWTACRDQAGGVAAANTVVSAAIAGASAAAGRARFFEATGGFAAAKLSTDAYASVIGAFQGQPGVLLSVGTGTVACRIDAAGRFARIGGWGFPAGDLGGGAWIGLRLVSAWLEFRDGVRPDDPVWEAIKARVGGSREMILEWLRAAAPADFAALAPIAFAAESAVAAAIVAEAVGHLAVLVQALGAEERVAVGGGLAPVMAGKLGQLLRRDVAMRPGATLAGAELIGRGEFAAEFG